MKYFFCNRVDRLGARLLPILNVVRLSRKLARQPVVDWNKTENWKEIAPLTDLFNSIGGFSVSELGPDEKFKASDHKHYKPFNFFYLENFTYCLVANKDIKENNIIELNNPFAVYITEDEQSDPQQVINEISEIFFASSFSDCLNRFINIPLDEYSCGIHARRGDLSAFFKGGHPKELIERYVPLNIVSKKIDALREEKSSFIIFSDCEELLNQYPDNIFNNKIENANEMQTALMDIIALSKAKTIYASKSAFSNLASILGKSHLVLMNSELTEENLYNEFANEIFVKESDRITDKALGEIAIELAKKIINVDRNTALMMAEKSLAISPNNSESLYITGNIKVLMGLHNEAHHYFRTALEINEKPYYRFALANCLFKMGKLYESHFHASFCYNLNSNDNNFSKLYEKIRAALKSAKPFDINSAFTPPFGLGLKNIDAEFQFKNSNENKLRTVIFSVSRFHNGKKVYVGGFADRMKGLFNAFLMAYLTNSNFYIDWDAPAELENQFIPNQSDWIIPDNIKLKLQSGLYKTLDLVDKNYQKYQQDLISINGLEHLLFDKSNIAVINCNRIDPDLPLVSENYFSHHISKIPKSLHIPKIASIIFNYLFLYNPKDNFLDLYSDVLNYIFINRNVIGVHFRIGGTTGGWNDPVLDSPDNLDALFLKVDALISLKNLTNPLIYFCSDSEDIKKLVLQKYCKQYDIFSTGGVITHLDRSSESSAKDGFGFLCLEMALLSQCNEIVCGKGGFSSLASWINGKLPHVYFK